MAQVNNGQASDMAELAKQRIPLPHQVTFTLLELVDMGHSNEKWELVETWSLLQPSMLRTTRHPLHYPSRDKNSPCSAVSTRNLTQNAAFSLS